MTASYKPSMAKIKLRVKLSTFYRIFKSYLIKNPPVFLSNKKFESDKSISFLLIKKNKKEIIKELKKEEKEINLTHLIRILVHLIKLFQNKKVGKECIYLKLGINQMFQLLRTKMNGKIRTNSIYLYSKNNSKDTKKIKEKKNSNIATIEDKNNSLNTKDSTTASFSKTPKTINFIFSKKNYCNYYPQRGEMRERVDKVPCHFPMTCFHGVAQHHNEIGNIEYLCLKDDNIFNSNNESYKIIDKKDHLLLNHICQKNVDKNIINSFTFRYRHKNTTFVYYK